MMSFFRRLFGSGRETGKTAPRSIRDIQGLTLRDLVDPVFPYVAPKDRLTEVPVDSPLHPAITARDAFFGKRCQMTEYLHILQNAAQSCPQEDLPYVWLAELHLIQGEYENANRYAFEGLNKARELERLTYMAGNAYLKMKDCAAIGWFIQSCLLATFEFSPYLFCSRCAKVAGFDDLYRRLLNASDAISPGSRIPDAEDLVFFLASKISRTELDKAMTKFRTNMLNCLPAVDVFPEHPGERDIFILAHSNDIRRDICVKLFARPTGLILEGKEKMEMEDENSQSTVLREKIQAAGGFRFLPVEGNPETMYAMIEGIGAIVLIKHSHLGFLRNVCDSVKDGTTNTDEQIMALQAVAILELIIGKERASHLRISNVMQVASAKGYLTGSISGWDEPCWLVMLKDERPNLGKSRGLGKACAVCGQEAGADAIACPQCGCGVFTSEKDHSESKNLKSAFHAQNTTKSRNLESGKFVSFMKTSFIRKGSPIDKPQEPKHNGMKLSRDQQIALFLPPMMLRGMSFAQGVIFNGVLVKIDQTIAEWALPFSERITSASKSFREGRITEAFQEFSNMSKILPTAAIILMNMGVCAASVGEKEKAKDFLRWSLQYVPAEFKNMVLSNLTKLQ